MSDSTRRLANFVGRGADDPELQHFVSRELGKRLRTSLSFVNDSSWVEAEDDQLKLLFETDVVHAAYPPLPRSSRTFVPYFSRLYFDEGYEGSLPFGVERDMSAKQLQVKLGAPNASIAKKGLPRWCVPVDEARGIVFSVLLGDEVNMGLEVDTARKLSGVIPPRPVVGLFVAWAARRGLLDAARFPEHAPLLAAVAAGTAPGSALLAAAMPRGVWDRHLLDRPGLRDFAYEWFHNMGKKYIVKDFAEIFGEQEDEHGHTAATLKDDTSAALERMAPRLDKRFADWL